LCEADRGGADACRREDVQQAAAHLQGSRDEVRHFLC